MSKKLVGASVVPGSDSSYSSLKKWHENGLFKLKDL